MNYELRIISYLCRHKWQSGGCMPPDVRESGENPELYLQL